MKRQSTYESEQPAKKQSQVLTNFELYELPYDMTPVIGECVMDASFGLISQYKVRDCNNQTNALVPLHDTVMAFIYLQTGASVRDIILHIYVHRQNLIKFNFTENDSFLLITLTVLSLYNKKSGRKMKFNKSSYDEFEKSIADQFNTYNTTKKCEATYGTIDEQDISLIDGQVFGDPNCGTHRISSRNIIIGAFKRNNFDIVNTIMELTM